MSEKKQELRRRSVSKENHVASPASEEAPFEARAPVFSKSKTAALIVTAVVLLTLIAFVYDHNTSFPTLRLPVNEASERRHLDQILFPENFTSRPPTVLHHTWRLSAAERFPDGARKRVYLINDQFPGPTIEARSGDTLAITVENALEGEDVAIHWHGLHMKDANEQDGAVGFTQCPIPPGRTFTYEFQISHQQHGTFWYHAHDQVQRADGLYGGLIVHEPAADTRNTNQYDEERLLLVGDHYHRPAEDVLAWYMRHASFGNEPVPESLLVNGVGAYDCDKVVPARPVECHQLFKPDYPFLEFDVSKRYRFRMVNVGTLAGINLTFSSLSFQTTVIEVDGGQKIVPRSTTSIGVLYPGERVDFIAQWTDASTHSQESLEFELDGENFKYPSPSLMAYHRFPIELVGKGERAEQRSSTSKPRAFSLVEAEGAVQLDRAAFPESANITIVVYTTTLKLARLKNIPHGFMNHTTWKPQQQPLLTVPRSQWDEHQLVPYIPYDPSNPIWIDLVINNIDDGSHPFHLHGMDFYVVASCVDGTVWGSYNPFDAPDGPPCGPYNTRNPVKRDTTFVPRKGYTVIRFQADNPGIWMFHCHILWHQASGMAMGFQVGGDEEQGVMSEWSQVRRDAAMRFCPPTK